MNNLIILSAYMCRRDIFMSKDFNQCERSGGFTPEEFIGQLWTDEAVQLGSYAISGECRVIAITNASVFSQEAGQGGEL